MRSGTELAREIQLNDWSTAGNLFNRSSGVQIPRGICTHFGRYLYSTKCSWIIKDVITRSFLNFEIITRGENSTQISNVSQEPDVRLNELGKGIRQYRVLFKKQFFSLNVFWVI